MCATPGNETRGEVMINRWCIGICNGNRMSSMAMASVQELDYLCRAITAPTRPFAALVGGSKVSSKISVLESLITKCDKLLIGCALEA